MAEKLQAISLPEVNYITHLAIDGGLVGQIAFKDTRGGRALPPSAATAKLKTWLTTLD